MKSNLSPWTLHATHMSMQILIPKARNIILFLSLGTPTRKNKILQL